MQCPNCKSELAVILAPRGVKTDAQPNVLGQGQTRIVDVGSQSGPYEGTGRATTIAPVADRDTLDLPPAESRNYSAPVGATVAFKVNLVPGTFRVGIGEYGDAGNFGSDIALSRTPHEIEGAPARDPKSITGIVIGDDPSQVFAAGEWFVNVRVNHAGTEGKSTQGFTVSYYNNP